MVYESNEIGFCFEFLNFVIEVLGRVFLMLNIAVRNIVYKIYIKES